MRKTTVSSMLFLAAGLGFGQEIPLNGWTVPPYAASSAGGITTMTDATPPRAFIGISHAAWPTRSATALRSRAASCWRPRPGPGT